MIWFLVGFLGTFSALVLPSVLRTRRRLAKVARDRHIVEMERECEIRDEKGDLVHPPIKPPSGGLRPPRSIDVRTHEDGHREITFEEKGRAWMEYHRTGDPTYIDYLIERMGYDRPGTASIHPDWALREREAYDQQQARLRAAVKGSAVLEDVLSREQRRIAASFAVPTIQIDPGPAHRWTTDPDHCDCCDRTE